MDPQHQLDEYCRRFGVGKDFGQRLLPLLQRAQKAPERVRARIIELVEASFEKEASLRAMKKKEERSKASRKEDQSPVPRTGDERMLHTVAALLHNWSPPAWTLAWGDNQRGRKNDGPGTDEVDRPETENS